jgi:hypothetical protein
MKLPESGPAKENPHQIFSKIVLAIWKENSYLVGAINSTPLQRF